MIVITTANTPSGKASRRAVGKSFSAMTENEDTRYRES
jgi:hypothetical protein